MSFQLHDTSLLIKINRLHTILVSRATGGENNDHDEYKILRQELIKDSRIGELLPNFVTNCRDTNQFWNFIKMKFPTYQERRKYIWEQFHLLLDTLEKDTILTVPSDANISELIEKFDQLYVYKVWQKSLDRRYEDPEGAITAARTLIESVCKHILDEVGESYDDKTELPKLYKNVAKQLNMAPEQHQEESFKQILGGCSAVIQGIGSIRNKLSDAHGKGRSFLLPSDRHAALAVNLAGSMAAFMISAWEEKKNSIQRSE
jgi:Abortive infection C-terminus